MWLNRDGRRVLQLGWSLAGTTEPGERRFELRVPPCATSSLELKLPADQVPTASADVLLTGSVSGREQSGTAAVAAAIRRPVESGVRAFAQRPAPVVVARRRSSMRVTNSRPDNSRRRLNTICNPPRFGWRVVVSRRSGLRIIDVTTINRAGWSVDAPAMPDGPRRVREACVNPVPAEKSLFRQPRRFPTPRDRMNRSPPFARSMRFLMRRKSTSGSRPRSRSKGGPRAITDWWKPRAPLLILPGGESSRVLSLVGTLLPPGAWTNPSPNADASR